MVIGDRLRALREYKKLSQGDIEKRTGLLRSHISRVEKGHTVPAIETLEKLARAMEVPLYHLFYGGDERPKTPHLPKGSSEEAGGWGESGRDRRTLNSFRNFFGRIDKNGRELLLSIAEKMVKTNGRMKAK